MFLSNITPETSIKVKQKKRKWSLIKAVDCETNSPCPELEKCAKYSIENMQTGPWPHPSTDTPFLKKDVHYHSAILCF